MEKFSRVRLGFGLIGNRLFIGYFQVRFSCVFSAGLFGSVFRIRLWVKLWIQYFLGQVFLIFCVDLKVGEGFFEVGFGFLGWGWGWLRVVFEGFYRRIYQFYSGVVIEMDFGDSCVLELRSEERGRKEGWGNCYRGYFIIIVVFLLGYRLYIFQIFLFIRNVIFIFIFLRGYV